MNFSRGALIYLKDETDTRFTTFSFTMFGFLLSLRFLPLKDF